MSETLELSLRRQTPIEKIVSSKFLELILVPKQDKESSSSFGEKNKTLFSFC